MKVHFKFKTQDKHIVYLCNWALNNPTRFAKTDKKVTCLNCKRIMKNFMIKNKERVTQDVKKYKTCKCKCHDEEWMPCDKCWKKDYKNFKSNIKDFA